MVGRSKRQGIEDRRMDGREGMNEGRYEKQKSQKGRTKKEGK